MYAKGAVDGDQREKSLFCVLWKDVSFVDPELDVKIESVEDGIKLILSAKNYARTVNISIQGRDDLEYSDNYFDILPGDTKTVFIKGKNIDNSKPVVNTWLDKWKH